MLKEVNPGEQPTMIISLDRSSFRQVETPWTKSYTINGLQLEPNKHRAAKIQCEWTLYGIEDAICQLDENTAFETLLAITGRTTGGRKMGFRLVIADIIRIVNETNEEQKIAQLNAFQLKKAMQRNLTLLQKVTICSYTPYNVKSISDIYENDPDRILGEDIMQLWQVEQQGLDFVLPQNYTPWLSYV